MKSTISLKQPSKARTASRVSVWLASENHLFFWILNQGEEEKVTVTNLQALYLLQALISFSFLCCFTFENLYVTLVQFFWFVLSLLQCKKGGLK